MQAHKTLLIILDGWGIGANPEVSAVAQAHTPFMNSLPANYPECRLEASGMAVGLPEGQMGNSEVGHMNLGAGRVVYQDLVKLNKAAEEGTFSDNETLQKAFALAKDGNRKLHFIGLLSDGGVHAHSKHLMGLLKAAQAAGVKRQYVHAFTDGRDTSPNGGVGYLQQLQPVLEQTGAKLASVIGRYYAMDRDTRWERVKLAYDLLVHGKGAQTQNAVEALQAAYANDETDEFIKPKLLTDGGKPVATIADDDVVICFNFRTDRGRQITEALTQRAFPAQQMLPLNLHYFTMTEYDETFKNVNVLYGKEKLKETLGEVLAKHNKTQLRIAETEKYPHVTFFFSGGEEAPFEGEERIMCPSPKVATYDLQPEMSANEIKDKVIPVLQQSQPDFICLNFANPDMVGHTGVFEAAVKACETADSCAKAVSEAALQAGYAVIIIADHGNAETMRNADGSAHTAHTTNLVPCFLLTPEKSIKKLKDGKLGDIAPTVLQLLQVEKPAVMTGQSIIAE